MEPLALPDPDRPVYRAEVSIDPSTGAVTGTGTTSFSPDQPIDDIVIRLWANGPRPSDLGARMELTELAIDGVPVEHTLADPTTAVVELGESIPAHTRIEISWVFDLVVPGQGRSRFSRTLEYMRLGSFLPLLPWEPGHGWATDPPTSLYAEAVLSPTADYHVKVTVPAGYDVLAAGSVDADSTWHAVAARDFAVSIGRFRIATATAEAPEPVQVTVGVHESVAEDEAAYLAKVVDSLERFSERFGAYPWPTLTLAVTPDLRGGIEFPTHIMQGPGSIGRTTSHEVGHMFFYSLVGNNQGAYPWLDEGLASYTEYTYEGTAANSWAIAQPGRATEPMSYWEAHGGDYYTSVYSQTGFALQQLGDRDTVDCALARYVSANAHRIARPADLIEAFEPDFPDIIDRLSTLGVNVTAD